MTFRRFGKDRSQVGCLGGAIIFSLWGLSKCNDLALWLPQWQASRVRAALEVGRDWPSALVAADRRLPTGKQLSASCMLAQGQVVLVGRLGARYIIHGCSDPRRPCDLKSGVTTYGSASEWEIGLRQLLLEPRLCQSVTVSTNGDYEVALDLDSTGAVRAVSSVTQRQ